MATSVQKKDPFSWRETFISAFPKVIDVLMSTDGISNIEMKDSLDHLKAVSQIYYVSTPIYVDAAQFECLS